MNLHPASLRFFHRQFLEPARWSPVTGFGPERKCFFPPSIGTQVSVPRRLLNHNHSNRRPYVGPEFGENKNPYDILGLSHHAKQSEIKRKFYELSKQHHPDHNKGDPSANDRFIELSHAYQFLSNPIRKASYDKSLRQHQPDIQPGVRRSERGPVGGREASGLSRRRTVPQGPPPSYYRMQRERATWVKDQRTGGPRSDGIGVGGQTSSRKDDVPHFNWDEKYRQHRDYQNRLQQSFRDRSQKKSRSDPSNILDLALQATLVGGCVLLAGVIGNWIASLRAGSHPRDSR